ncbi:30S ribosomal protein S7 [Candidatus Pacearchaeota archaeon]|nr:30S ribosomal protein S7 [Candidatus Pacearchaeota archaeon]|tara:strand:- start:1558 stop:2151 length:594 start_codon:yes stop_codon:yes gene_type:complete
MEMKIFGLFDASTVEVKDPGLKRVVNLQPKLLLKSHGRVKYDPARAKVNVVERLINLLQVPGSRGKKHRIITKWMTGKHAKASKIVIDAFKIIEEKTNESAMKIFVQAIENAAPRDEVTSIEYGGARYPQAVDVSPRRRLNLVLRFLVNGAYDKAFNKKANITESLAKEIILAAENSSESYAVSKKNDAEKQADAAR